jgi:hypothetical protein
MLAVVAACGSSRPAQPLVPPQPMSAEEHRAEAERHEAEAKHLEAEAGRNESAGHASDYRCGDTVLFDQSTSGTERLTLRVPCWSAEVAGSDAQRRAAARAHEEAAHHRAAARNLEQTESKSCGTMAPDERDHSPFWHRSDILTVTRVDHGGHLQGATILFRRVPSLTTEWMKQAISCQQARAAALGWDPSYMSYDPSLHPDARVEVKDDRAGVRVTISSGNSDAAALIASRAEALMKPELEGVAP